MEDEQPAHFPGKNQNFMLDVKIIIWHLIVFRSLQNRSEKNQENNLFQLYNMFNLSVTIQCAYCVSQGTLVLNMTCLGEQQCVQLKAP